MCSLRLNNFLLYFINQTFFSFQVNFEKFGGCPFCGRYLLRIDLELSREARSTGFRKMFNIGDSQSNDGYSKFYR